MAYALQSMLRIRRMKEDRAQTNLAKARADRRLAEIELERRSDAVIRFEATKDERRDKIYETVIGRVVKMDDLDHVRAAVTQVDEEGLLLAEAERKAGEEVKRHDQLVDAAHGLFVTALKDREKIEQHRRIWLEEEHREQERIADNEMDEFAVRKVSYDD